MKNDTIYRREAIDAIEKLNIPEDMCVFEILSHIEVEIGTLPSAQQWTPCAEKLPEKWEVLCCNKYGDYLLGHPYENESSETGFSAESDEALLTDCIAWMNLPEVYKGEKENEPGE